MMCKTFAHPMSIFQLKFGLKCHAKIFPFYIQDFAKPMSTHLIKVKDFKGHDYNDYVCASLVKFSSLNFKGQRSLKFKGSCGLES